MKEIKGNYTNAIVYTDNMEDNERYKYAYSRLYITSLK